MAGGYGVRASAVCGGYRRPARSRFAARTGGAPLAKLTIAADEQALAEAAAERLTALVEPAIDRYGSATVSLTGGSTPRRLYALLGDAERPWRARIDWARVHLFWGDERHVPPDHADSNYGMARTALLDHVPVVPGHVHRMRGEMADASEAARAYEQELQDGFAAAGRSDLTFDVMLLGLGDDAHIASVFPGSELLQRPKKGPPTSGEANPDQSGRHVDSVGRPFMGRHVAAVWAPHLTAWRITLTPAAILDARRILTVVAGKQKAAAVHAALQAPPAVTEAPAQLLREAADRVEWMLDEGAARDLTIPRSRQ